MHELQGQVVVYAEKKEDSVNKDTKALIILVAAVFVLGFFWDAVAPSAAAALRVP